MRSDTGLLDLDQQLPSEQQNISDQHKQQRKDFVKNFASALDKLVRKKVKEDSQSNFNGEVLLEEDEIKNDHLIDVENMDR